MARHKRTFSGIPIRCLRRERKLTLEQVAIVVGTDTGNLSRIERGQQVCGPELAERIARFYRVPETMVLYPDRYMRQESAA